MILTGESMQPIPESPNQQLSAVSGRMKLQVNLQEEEKRPVHYQDGEERVYERPISEEVISHSTVRVFERVSQFEESHKQEEG